MDAIELLHTQHQKVKGIFEKLENGKGDAIANVLDLIDNLAAHMAIEQDIFYPEVIAADPDLVSEAFEEHSIAEFALKRLLATGPEEDAFKARVVAAKELIEHHVKEEEDELFKKAKKMLGKDRLEELGAQMKKRFDEVYASGYQSAVPSRLDKTSADAARADLHVTGGSHEPPARQRKRSRATKASSSARSLPRVGKAKKKKTSRASR
jgi:hemerythrin-like domain-containing protein